MTVLLISFRPKSKSISQLQLHTPTPRNLLNDMARRQRAKEDKKRAIALHKKSHTEPLAKDSVKGYDPEQQKKGDMGRSGP